MYTYKQSTGEIFHGGKLIASGYSGRGVGLNQPKAQNVRGIGPVPQGQYTIGAAGTVPHLGPEAMPLQPHEGNEMFGRAGFFIHGDNALNNHTASEGCIILPRAVRDGIAESGDDQLTVIA